MLRKLKDLPVARMRSARRVGPRGDLNPQASWGWALIPVLLCAFNAAATPLPPEMRKKNARSKSDVTKVAVRRIDQIAPTSTAAPAPKNAVVGAHSIAVVLIETDDAKFSDKHIVDTVGKQFFDREHPSLAHYYAEQSYGSYTLSGKVFGPVHIKGNLDQFAFAPGVPADNVKKLVGQAFDAVQADIDMAVFDRYNTFSEPKPDGVVDHFAVIFPSVIDGSEGHFKPIWPHRTTIEYGTGKKLKNYYIFANPMPLGTLAHEHGHDIGLPDLYDRDDSSHGAGPWCLMAAGTWLAGGDKPAHISAWGKIAMGWVRPQIVTRSNPRVAIAAVEKSPTVLKLPMHSADSQEYLLIENRQHLGYDAELPEEGLLIWHIDQGVKNNDDENHKLVDLIEPSAVQDLDQMLRDQDPDERDTFRAGKRSKITSTTVPSSNDYSGKDTGIAITNISASKGVMTASISVPSLNTPDGEPYTVSRDNYAYGAFGAMPQPTGSEDLMPLQATDGAFDLEEVEMLLYARPHVSSPLAVNVYEDEEGVPGKLRASFATKVTMQEDSYAWLKARLPQTVRIPGKARFWLGVRHDGDQLGLAYNEASVSREARLRTPEKELQDSFELKSGPEPIPDYIIRAKGYGFIGVKDAKAQAQADDSDALIVGMKEADALLDAHKYLEAAAQYSTVLQGMTSNPRRFATWIPVVINALGVSEYQAKNYPRALDYFARSLRYTQMMGDPRAEADVTENMGETYFHAGNLALAETYCMRASKLNKDVPDRLLESEYWLARILTKKKNKLAAKKHLAAASALVASLHKDDPALKSKWKARLLRAKFGTARGEDAIEGNSRLAEDLGKERRSDVAEDMAENNQARQIDLMELAPAVPRKK